MKKDTYIYPVIFYHTPEGPVSYFVDVPDFEAPTQGIDYPDALDMAEDLICCMIEDLEEKGTALPVPSALTDVQVDQSIGTERFVVPVVVDYAAWKRKKNNRSVHKNCSIPEWLALEAEKAGINFSYVLQGSLKQVLGIDME